MNIDWSPPQLPIVHLDVDGVLADFVTPMLDTVNKVLNRSYKHEDITSHDIEDVLELTANERTLVRAEIDRNRMARHLDPYPGVIEAVNRLRQSANVYFLTANLSSSQTWTYDRSEWLDKHFGDGSSKKAIFTKEKYLVQGNIFIDDMPYNIVKWARMNKKNPHTYPILWSQWYNVNHSLDEQDSNINRWHSWAKVESLVWDITSRRDPLSVWMDNNESFIKDHANEYISVNPYLGIVLTSPNKKELNSQVDSLPHDIKKDMFTYYQMIAQRL